MLHRSVTKQVIEDLGVFSVGIIGPKQMGGTTLAKYVQEKLHLDTLYLDLELESDYRRLSDAEAFLKFYQNKCMIIDEVQRMPKLFSLLRALVDIERMPARFIILGSASPILLRGAQKLLQSGLLI